MIYRDEESLKVLICRMQQKVFVLAFYLLNGDTEKAKELAAESFAEAIYQAPQLEKEQDFMMRLCKKTVNRCKKTKPSEGTPAAQDSLLRSKNVVQMALMAMSFEPKALIMLRDQSHMLYGEIASIFGMPESEAKARTFHSRGILRDKIKETLEREIK